MMYIDKGLHRFMIVGISSAILAGAMQFQCLRRRRISSEMQRVGGSVSSASFVVVTGAPSARLIDVPANMAQSASSERPKTLFKLSRLPNRTAHDLVF